MSAFVFGVVRKRVVRIVAVVMDFSFLIVGYILTDSSGGVIFFVVY